MSQAKLVYSLVCDDVRLEVGNKISRMGVFENVFLPTFPSALVKVAVVNHWKGEGQFETRVLILGLQDRELATFVPSRLVIEQQGYADNVTFFTNVTFDQAGTYRVRTYLDGALVAERPLFVHRVVNSSTMH